MTQHGVDRPFSERVYAVVRRIPRGMVTTYGHIALLIDAPRSARQVGRALRLLSPELAWDISMAAPTRRGHAGTPDPQTLAVPWHRVVTARSCVAPRGPGGAVARQVALLRAEGVAVTDDGALEAGLEVVGWFPQPWPTDGDRPESSMLFDDPA